MGRRHTAAAVIASAATLAAGPALMSRPAPDTTTHASSGLVTLAAAAHPNSANSRPVTMADVAQISGAAQYWSTGVTGDGVDVAVIDSGVTPVPGLDAAGKVVYGPDFTADGATAGIANLDLVGHGTHMAGIIAGNDPATGFSGMAPDARIVSVKVADPDGTTDVTRVLQAVSWVTQHKDDGDLHIRVLNLSLGAMAQGDYQRSLLSAAVEKAWRAGITVVAASGNDGASTRSLSDPAYDPYVLAVGAADTHGTIAVSDDKAATFSNSGSASRMPDLLAPGMGVQSLRVPGSLADAQAPSTTNSPTINGSGSSQATAVVSGAVALVLQQHPEFTPDQVKAALVASDAALRAGANRNQGITEMQLAKLATSATIRAVRAQSWKASTITDSQLDTATLVVDGVRWTGVRWTGVRWTGVRWTGVRWTGDSWT
jgi:serine protease AprX